MSELVAGWFGTAHERLDPLLQSLHRDGGRLLGACDVTVGRGLAGVLGRRIVRRWGLHLVGANQMDVTVAPSPDALRWHRSFNGRPPLSSRFVPFGRFPDGHWQESSGRLALELGVALEEGNWIWHQRAARLGGLPLPAWLAPRVQAAKCVVAGKYVFSVRVALPLLGTLVSYAGTLDARVSDASRSSIERPAA